MKKVTRLSLTNFYSLPQQHQKRVQKKRIQQKTAPLITLPMMTCRLYL